MYSSISPAKDLPYNRRDDRREQPGPGNLQLPVRAKFNLRAIGVSWKFASSPKSGRCRRPRSASTQRCQSSMSLT